MSTMERDQLVDEYVQRLEAAAAHWQRSRRAELVAEIREHIDAALAQEERFDEAAVRNVLERLGEPEEIVDAADPSPPTAPSARVGAIEIIALLALLVPFVGWLVGMVLVFVSEAWARRDKVIGIALLLLVLLLPFVGFTLGSAESGMDESVPVGDPRPVGLKEEGGPGGAEVVLLAMAAGLPSALYLGWRLRRHHPAPSS